FRRSHVPGFRNFPRWPELARFLVKRPRGPWPDHRHPVWRDHRRAENMKHIDLPTGGGRLRRYLAISLVAAAALGAAVPEAFAAQTVNKGDTTWMLTATILVILMTIPGLALFYGGLVRSKNALSV